MHFATVARKTDATLSIEFSRIVGDAAGFEPGAVSRLRLQETKL
jgi:hypothetical protein